MKNTSIFLLFLATIFTACEEENITNTETKTAIVAGYLFSGQPCDSIRITQATSYGGSDSLTVTLDALGGAAGEPRDWRPARARNLIPHAVVEIFERHGFIWGGKWFHYDTMHFEYRPELLLT